MGKDDGLLASPLNKSVSEWFSEMCADLENQFDRRPSAGSPAADPVLAAMVPMMTTADPSEIRAAVLWVLDSGEARVGAELVRYFAHRFRWDWLEDELRHRFRDRSSARDWRATRWYE
ncbi:hypothetical protein ABZ412_35695 [Nocardia sp. NPDC005746]|uniref:hypothetical protein n=1 Tax=Nocardia sp. NPDC005746 TaxID=3157062 RepID=UPI0033DA13B4